MVTTVRPSPPLCLQFSFSIPPARRFSWNFSNPKPDPNLYNCRVRRKGTPRKTSCTMNAPADIRILLYRVFDVSRRGAKGLRPSRDKNAEKRTVVRRGEKSLLCPTKYVLCHPRSQLRLSIGGREKKGQHNEWDFAQLKKER